MHVRRRSDTFPADIAAVVDAGFAEAKAGARAVNSFLFGQPIHAAQALKPPAAMAKCVKPLGHLARLSAKPSRSTNQNAPFGRLSTTLY
jgi:hypothetical protein